MERQVLGIDFGTSFSSVAVLFQRKITVIQDEMGSAFIPSVVCFRDKEKVGAGAEHFKKRYPKNTVYEIKRVVGCRYDDEVVQHQKEKWPFDIVEGKDHRVQVELMINDKLRHFYPEYIISKILNYLVQLAENTTGEKYTKAIITVPANFNDTQRKCIRVAARFAKLEILRILDEPVAAAVAISIDTNIDNSRVLVYDLGGGTFDFTILEVAVNDYRVIATDGDPNLGGADFTYALTEFATQMILNDTGIDANKNPRMAIELRSVCENIKQELSTTDTASLDLDLSRYGGTTYSKVITRTIFESVIREYIQRSVQIVKSCLETYHIDISTVSGIALVGGSSSIPLIRTELHRVYPTLRILSGYDPRQVVCRGALVQALSLISDENGNDEPIPVAITPPSIVNRETPAGASETNGAGAETPVHAPPAPPSKPLAYNLVRPSAMVQPPPVPSQPLARAPPKRSSLQPGETPDVTQVTRRSNPARSIADSAELMSPESSYGLVNEIQPICSTDGAAPSIPPPGGAEPIPVVVDPSEASTNPPPLPPITATLNTLPPLNAPSSTDIVEPGHRDFSRIKIQSTTPLDLGIRVKGNLMSVIIPRNSPLPITKSKPYKANREHPECVRCCIYQGNSKDVAFNSKIGIVHAYDLPVYEGVRNEIMVTFTIDEGGELSVNATLMGCQAEVKIEMLDSVVLPNKEIETILEEDMRDQEEIEQSVKDELFGAIDLRLQELETRDDDESVALMEREQEWLNNNRDTASIDEIRNCLNRLSV